MGKYARLSSFAARDRWLHSYQLSLSLTPPKVRDTVLDRCVSLEVPIRVHHVSGPSITYMASSLSELWWPHLIRWGITKKIRLASERADQFPAHKTLCSPSLAFSQPIELRLPPTHALIRGQQLSDIECTEG